MRSDSTLGRIRQIKSSTGALRYAVTIGFKGRRLRRRFLRLREAQLYVAQAAVKIAEGQFLPAQESASLLRFSAEFLTDSKKRKSEKTFEDVDSLRLVRFLKFAYHELQGKDITVGRYRLPELVMAGNQCKDLTEEEKQFTRFLNRLKVERITAELLERFQQQLLGEIKPVSVKGYITTLKVALNLALRRGWIRQNPAAVLPRILVPKRIPRFLLKEEIAQLLRYSKEHPLFGVVATGIFGGLRSGELTHLEWQDVDFDNNLIHVRVKSDWAPKWQRERDVPMEPLLKESLWPLRRESGLCFPTEEGTTREDNVLRDLKALEKRAGLKELVSVHGLRHTYGSHLTMAGVPLTDTSAWMGHSTLSTTLLYAHLAPGRNRFRRDSVFDVPTLEALMKVKEAEEKVPIVVIGDRRMKDAE